jgi:hypothetical protein
MAEKPAPHVVLLVEGSDDVAFFESLAENLALSNIRVEAVSGKYNFREYLKVFVNQRPGFHEIDVLVIVRDADEQPEGAFQSACGALETVDLAVPDRPFTITGQRPRIAVIILPDADQPGELEDLCLQALEDNPIVTCIEKYFQCLEKAKVDLPKKIAKIKIHTFLDVQTTPTLKFEDSIRQHHWPFEHEAFDKMKAFLRLLASA